MSRTLPDWLTELGLDTGLKAAALAAAVVPVVAYAGPPADHTMVVINHEEQYSVWPKGTEVPTGWSAVKGKTCAVTECAATFERVLAKP